MNHRAENHDEHTDQHAIHRLRGEPSQKLEATPDGQHPDHPRLGLPLRSQTNPSSESGEAGDPAKEISAGRIKPAKGRRRKADLSACQNQING